jgi:uncharacterized protein YutD
MELDYCGFGIADLVMHRARSKEPEFRRQIRLGVQVSGKRKKMLKPEH